MSAAAPDLVPSSLTHLRAVDRARLDAQLSPAVREWPIEVVEQTTSTNADLVSALRDEPAAVAGFTGLARARVKVAYEQTAGRGRRGRTWVAQPGEALLFSVAGWLPRGVEGLGGLSLAVGLAVHDALRELPVDASRVTLKWPNDVLVDAAKVSGILIETAGSTRDATALVVGIGINLRGSATIAAAIQRARTAGDGSAASSATATATAATNTVTATGAGAGAGAGATPAQYSAATNARAAADSTRSALAAPPTPPTALDAMWAEPSMTDLLAHLLNRLATTFDAFGTHGFAPLREAWCKADSYRDLPVALYEGGDAPTCGIGRGVDDIGQLLIETPDGVRTIASGDVSLRAA